MADFKRPIDAVADALPGTVGEVSAATGYPPETVLSLIVRLRAEGTRVNAAEDGSRAVGRALDRENPTTAGTIFAVDSSSGNG